MTVLKAYFIKCIDLPYDKMPPLYRFDEKNDKTPAYPKRGTGFNSGLGRLLQACLRVCNSSKAALIALT